MNKSLQNIKQFKAGSIFFRFYSLIVVLVLVLISIFSFYIYGVYIRHQNEQRESAQTAFLDQISGKIDNSLLLLSENGRSIWQNPVLIPAVIVPSMEKKAQNFDATTFLAQNVTNFEYFDRLILHEQTRDLVYSSSGGVHTLDLSGESELLSTCVRGSERTILSEVPHQYDVSLVRYESDYYMVWRYIEARHMYLGSLIAKLNMDALFSGLSDALSDSGYGLRIIDSAGNALFAAGVRSDTDTTVNDLFSAISGFHLYLTSPDTVIASPLSYFRFTLPFIAVVLIAGLAFSLFVAERVYHPINQLLFSLPESAAEHPDARSELDLLTKTLDTMRSDKEAADAFREQVRPEMEKNLLQRLLEGNLEVEESLPEQLAEIRSKLRENGKYQALIACLPKAEGIDTVVQYMALRQISLKIENACGEEPADIYPLHPQDNQMPLIIQFNEELSLAKCKQIYPHLLNALRGHDLIDRSVLLAAGSIYQGITSVPDSFREAEQILRKSLYYNSEESGDSSVSSTASLQEQYLATRLNRLKELYSKRELLLFEEFLTMLLKDLQTEDTDLSAYRTNCAAVLTALHEIVIENDLQEESGSAGRRILSAREQLQKIDRREELYPFMTAECDAVIRLLREQLSSRQQILVAQARNYIKMNYSNCDLSIHEVSESLGISDAYLSTIFNEQTGESPIGYLNAYRIGVARQLLANSDIIIKDIGYKTGFSTIQNFNRVFKRLTGMTPGEYRKHHLPD